jgi:putative endonuclease
MIKVYLLKSLKNGTLYVGMTEDLERRLLEHNKGKSKFTKGHLPWSLLYAEEFPDYTSARKREKYLKSTAGKNWLRKNNIIK